MQASGFLQTALVRNYRIHSDRNGALSLKGLKEDGVSFAQHKEDSVARRERVPVRYVGSDIDKAISHPPIPTILPPLGK